MKTSPNHSLKGGELARAVQILKKGGVVVYPTDTAYGLAVDATNVTAVKKLFALKGRNFKNPIHVIPPTPASIGKFARVSRLDKKIIDGLMPGPLTLVVLLKSNAQSWKLLSAGTKTIGIRRPKNKLALDLALKLGKPITTTSANVSGQPTCYSVSEVKKQFIIQSIKPAFYLDGGKLKKTLPSTVVSLIKDVKILRQGPITETQIKKCISHTG